MSAAAVAQASVPASRAAVWTWDITAPLPRSTKVGTSARPRPPIPSCHHQSFKGLPISQADCALPTDLPQEGPGLGAQRLCSMLAESVSRSLATRWGEGHHSFVQAMLLLPDASSATSSEQQVGRG